MWKPNICRGSGKEFEVGLTKDSQTGVEKDGFTAATSSKSHTASGLAAVIFQELHAWKFTASLWPAPGVRQKKPDSLFLVDDFATAFHAYAGF